MTYIHHVCCNTGEVVRVERNQVLARLEHHALHGGPVPEANEYRLASWPRGNCWQGAIYAECLPLAQLAIATRAQCGARQWRRLHTAPSLATRLDERPPEPWCATVLYPAMETRTDVARWLDGYVQALAWSWVELRESAKEGRR